MANWARLQEQLTGLPVVKRARHSIHFDNGDGQVVANFSGKPCHYEDKGVWKPIDTTLLLGADGFYGCPHSPVKVHKDGHVKVDKSDYSQFSELPGSPIGKVDGNHIVREFPGGRQYLYVTEDGFREEIVVDKPTFPLEKFIGKTSGTLPSAYKASPQTAVDANGDVFEITSDTKAFGDWLYRAAYPVTIDPDFSGTSSGGDNYIRSANSTNYGTGDALQLTNNRHILMRFDLSSVPAGVTVTAAAMRFNARAGWNAIGMTMNEISDANGDWGETTCSWLYKVNSTSTGWAGSAGLSTSGTDYKTTEFIGSSSTTYQPEHSNSRCDIVVSSGGLSAMEGWCGQSSNNGLIFRTTATSYTFVCTKEHATEYFRPLLTVTYTTGSTGVPKHFLHYARMRG